MKSHQNHKIIHAKEILKPSILIFVDSGVRVVDAVPILTKQISDIQ